jgi:NAD(P) transhydrogenase subunit alpha
MQIGIPKESFAGETRVAATPATVQNLMKLGFTVLVEKGAGELANFDDNVYVEAGAEIGTKAQVWACS